MCHNVMTHYLCQDLPRYSLQVCTKKSTGRYSRITSSAEPNPPESFAQRAKLEREKSAVTIGDMTKRKLQPNFPITFCIGTSGPCI